MAQDADGRILRRRQYVGAVGVGHGLASSKEHPKPEGWSYAEGRRVSAEADLRRGATPTAALGVCYTDDLPWLRRGLAAVGAAADSCSEWGIKMIKKCTYKVYKSVMPDVYQPGQVSFDTLTSPNRFSACFVNKFKRLNRYKVMRLPFYKTYQTYTKKESKETSLPK
jgi:hypothetical protein